MLDNISYTRSLTNLLDSTRSIRYRVMRSAVTALLKPVSEPSWQLSTTTGNNFTPRTGHAVARYWKATWTDEEKKIRYAFVSTQHVQYDGISSVPYIPVEINKLIFSFIENPLEKKIFLFGGTNNKQRLRDLHEYNTGTGVWRQLSLSVSLPQPARRSGAKAVMLERSLFVFGESRYIFELCTTSIYLFSSSIPMNSLQVATMVVEGAISTTYGGWILIVMNGSVSHVMGSSLNLAQITPW